MPPTYPAITDNAGMPGEWLVKEADEKGSRENILLDGIASAQELKSGTVLGLLRNPTVTDAPWAANTGNGTIGTVTPGAGAKLGVYKAICIEPGANVGQFAIYYPDGTLVGTATVAVAFTGGGLTFTIADGSTDFIAGDGFDITVAAGTKYVVHDQDGTDGSEIAAGILLLDTSVAINIDKKAVMIARDAQVREGGLIWQSDIDAGEIATAVAQLEALRIHMRQGDV